MGKYSQALAALGQELAEKDSASKETRNRLREQVVLAHSQTRNSSEPLTKYRIAQLTKLPAPTIGRWINQAAAH